MKHEKPANKESEPARPNWALYAGAAAVILAAVVLFNMGYFGPQPPASANQTNSASLSSPAAKLLLASFDRGAALTDYSLDYREIDNGVESRYQITKNGSRSRVLVQGGFGRLEGFFGASNATDVLCLTYNNATKCAMEGNDSDVKSVAGSLKALLPDSATYMTQKEQYRKLISAGAIVFGGGPADDKVGSFDTQRIDYALNYRGLTVDQLLSLGMSSQDPSVTSYTDQKVSFWVDRGTGLVVRSLATWTDGLKKASYERVYSGFALGGQEVPLPPSQLVPPAAFAQFYGNAVNDYVERETCATKATQGEQDACFKSAAVDRNSVELCRRINDRKELENCALIVAQNTQDAAVCEGLDLLRDDCLIAVAGENGDFGLCKILKNPALAQQCTQAATEGAKKAAAKEEQARKLAADTNCAADPDCVVFGNAGQYCAPANSTGQFANGTSAEDACFKGLPCGCLNGFCGFAKNDTYYSCVNDAETVALENYIKQLADQARANRTGANNTNKSG